MPAAPLQPRRLTFERALAPALFVLLIVATLAAFAAAQRLKREPLVLDNVTVHPLAGGQTVITPNDVARIRFRLTKTDHAIAEIIDRNDRVVRVLPVKVISHRGRVIARLAPGEVVPAYKKLVVRWDGRTGSGLLAPTGPYRLRVRLLGEDRTLVPGATIRVHTLAATGGGAGR